MCVCEQIWIEHWLVRRLQRHLNRRTAFKSQLWTSGRKFKHKSIGVQTRALRMWAISTEKCIFDAHARVMPAPAPKTASAVGLKFGKTEKNGVFWEAMPRAEIPFLWCVTISHVRFNFNIHLSGFSGARASSMEGNVQIDFVIYERHRRNLTHSNERSCVRGWNFRSVWDVCMCVLVMWSGNKKRETRHNEDEWQRFVHVQIFGTENVSAVRPDAHKRFYRTHF